MIKKLLLFCNIVVVLGTLLAYLAPYVDPEKTWIVSFFGLFYPILLILNLVFVFLWLWVGWRYAFLSVLCIVVGWTQLRSFIAFNEPGISISDQQITITSYNISNGRFGYDNKKSNRDEKKAALIEYLQTFENTDIFCLQEVREYGYDIIRKVFPEYHLHYTGKGAVILSRYPFLKKGEIDFGTITNSCLWADVKIENSPVRVYSFHLQSNQISQDAENLSLQTEFDQKRAWYDIKGILRKYKNRHITRSRQAEKLAAHAKKSPHPVILSGDMNDPPQSYTYQMLSRLGTDSFDARGKGLGTTYAGNIPLLRIDYIFSDPVFSVLDFKIRKERFSDHYAISAVLERTNNNAKEEKNE